MASNTVRLHFATHPTYFVWKRLKCGQTSVFVGHSNLRFQKDKERVQKVVKILNIYSRLLVISIKFSWTLSQKYFFRSMFFSQNIFLNVVVFWPKDFLKISHRSGFPNGHVAPAGAHESSNVFPWQLCLSVEHNWFPSQIHRIKNPNSLYSKY